jgi:pilus assembly protein Flp/PilA
MSTFTSAVKTFMADENGVTAIEYGLIAALIGVAVAVAAGDVGDGLKNIFGKIKTELTSAVFP